VEIFPAPFVEEAAFSPTHILGTFVKNQMAIVAWVCVTSIPLVFVNKNSTMLFLLLWLCV
jgi:hypothetical protein